MSLEICIDSVESAYEVLIGGANRIEICSELSVGGLTPTKGHFLSIFTVIRGWHHVEQRVMIRPRSGDFAYSEKEIDAMCDDIRTLLTVGARGFVFGVLNKNYTLNERACKRLISAAAGAPCTLHRCFDWTVDWKAAMDTAVELGFDTILTSGQKPTVGEAIDTLKEMSTYANTRTIVKSTGRPITIMAGSGLNESSLNQLLTDTDISWFHGSASTAIAQAMHGPPPFPMGPHDSELRRSADRNVVRLLRETITAARNV